MAPQNRFIQRIPWDRAKQTPDRVIAAYTDFPETPDLKSLSGKERSFQEKRLTAKGRFIDSGKTQQDAVNAAKELIAEALDKNDGEHVRAVYDAVCGKLTKSEIARGVTVYVPLKVRFSKKDQPNDPMLASNNALAVIYDLELAARLSKMAKSRGDKVRFECNPTKRIFKMNSKGLWDRAESDTVGRFSRQPVYDASQFKPGDKVLLADDHGQAGSATKVMLDALENRGAQVLGVAMFGCLPETLCLKPAIDVPKAVHTALEFNKQITGSKKSVGALERELNGALNQVGVSLDSLTNREALMLIGLLIDKSDSRYVTFFDGLKKQAGVNPALKEPKDDSLGDDLLNRKVMTPGEFAHQLLMHKLVGTIMSHQPTRDPSTYADKGTKPFVLISAGGPAVGKAAMIEVMKNKKFFPQKTVFIQHDTLKEFFSPEDYKRHFHPEQLKEYGPIYLEACKYIFDYATKNGYSVVMESHMQNVPAMHELLAMAKSNHYENFAVGLNIDEATHKRHREESKTLDNLTPISVLMMKKFARNWVKLVGDFDYAVLFERKKLEGKAWNEHVEERISKTAEYTCDHDQPTCFIYNEDDYAKFERWQKITVDTHAKSWGKIITAENGKPVDFPGRVVRGEEASRARQKAQPQGTVETSGLSIEPFRSAASRPHL